MAIYQDKTHHLVRLRWVMGLLVVVLLGLFLRLWHLSVVKFEHYQALAERNHVLTVPMDAPRGLIFDREGRVLVDNAHAFNLVLYRNEVQDLESTLSFLIEGFKLRREGLDDRLRGARHYSIYQPLVIKKLLSIDEIVFLLAHQTEHPELAIVSQPRRTYRYGVLAAHVLGYVGEVSRKQLGRPEFSENSPGDVVGKYAIERVYNRHLSGKDGYKKVLVNSVGKKLEELGHIPAKAGKELKLTLDLDLQEVAERELADRVGTIVALQPQTGEVLAMASRPAFDPNRFTVRFSREEWNSLVRDPDHPLQNRATQSSSPPGSIFKLVMALAGLEKGVVGPETSVYCSGQINLYGHPFRCWKKNGHGRVTLRESIRQSCNVYFYLLGQKLGIDTISEFSSRCGLGQRTGIDLSGEVLGLVPSSKWKKRIFGTAWYPGETISVSIGQGPIHVTPIQLARAVSIIAAGQAPPIHLVREPLFFRKRKLGTEIGLAPEHQQFMREAMWSVVNQYGTGRAARVVGFDVCGKTGSAQTIGRASREKLSKEKAAQFTSNAWFVGFAPRDLPEIVVVVLVEKGGAGGSAAAPLAGKLMQAFYEKYKASQPFIPNSLVLAHKNQVGFPGTADPVPDSSQ